MNFRLQPNAPLHQSAKAIAIAQVDDIMASGGLAAAAPKAVHEARKTIKRLRALFSLIGDGIAPGDLKRERQRLRDLAGSLAGARDAHVMSETARSLAEDGMPRGCRPVSEAVAALLEERRAAADSAMIGGDGRSPLKGFEDLRDALDALSLAELRLEGVLSGLAKTYRAGRDLHGPVFASGVHDEAFHDLRKQVQRHWRHLQLVSGAWPKALRPQIGLAHELGEMLGRDHDLAVLAAFVRDNAESIGSSKGREAYVSLIGKVQVRLRAHASVLAQRLYAEKPKALKTRVRVYWRTAGALDEAVSGRPREGKVIALNG